MLCTVSITEQTGCTDRWKALEPLIGRDGFNEVFTHTRTIFAQEHPKKSLPDEFREFVVNRTAPKGLIDDILTPCTKAYFTAKKGRTFWFYPFCCGLLKLCLNVLGCFFCTDVAAVDAQAVAIAGDIVVGAVVEAAAVGAGFEAPRQAVRLKKVTRSPSFSAHAAPAA